MSVEEWPRIFSSSRAPYDARPRANSAPSGPSTRTGSPTSNSPCTSTTPAGSRLRFPSHSARTAPASTTSAPERREPIVVAELDLLDGDGVVLVDDGEHGLREQLLEGVARVQEAAPAREVGVREQDLRDHEAVLLERRLPERHEVRLADRRRRL